MSFGLADNFKKENSETTMFAINLLKQQIFDTEYLIRITVTVSV